MHNGKWMAIAKQYYVTGLHKNPTTFYCVTFLKSRWLTYVIVDFSKHIKAITRYMMVIITSTHQYTNPFMICVFVINNIRRMLWCRKNACFTVQKPLQNVKFNGNCQKRLNIVWNPLLYTEIHDITGTGNGTKTGSWHLFQQTLNCCFITVTLTEP